MRLWWFYKCFSSSCIDGEWSWPLIWWSIWQCSCSVNGSQAQYVFIISFSIDMTFWLHSLHCCYFLQDSSQHNVCFAEGLGCTVKVRKAGFSVKCHSFESLMSSVIEYRSVLLFSIDTHGLLFYRRDSKVQSLLRKVFYLWLHFWFMHFNIVLNNVLVS